LSNNVFTAIGLFVVSTLSFALVTACFGGTVTDFDRSDWSIFAWFIGAIIYGITFVVLCM
jgi:hypothetical protein